MLRVKTIAKKVKKNNNSNNVCTMRLVSNVEAQTLHTTHSKQTKYGFKI